MRSAYFEAQRLLQKCFCGAAGYAWRATIFATFVYAAPQAASAAHAAQTGLRAVPLSQPAPDFAFDVGAGTQHLHDLAGRPVVISFWATWCRPCLDELPVFVRLKQTYGEKVALITVSSEAPDVARSYLTSQNIDVPVVEDPNRRIFGEYSVDPIPVTLVLDGGGRTRHVSVGELTWDELSAAVDAVLPPEAK